MTELITERSIFGLNEETLFERTEELNNLCKDLVEKQETFYGNYIVSKHALDIIKEMNSQGIKIIGCSNCNNPVKRIKLLEALGVNELFDGIFISGFIGCRKPNPSIIANIKQEYPYIKNHEIFLVGDSIINDISIAHMAGIRSIYFAYKPKNKS